MLILFRNGSIHRPFRNNYLEYLTLSKRDEKQFLKEAHEVSVKTT